MRIKKLYPINLKLLSDRKNLVYDIFRKVKPHKGAFIGVCKLDGSFLCDDIDGTFASLAFSELLYVVKDETGNLTVRQSNGNELGILPYADSVLPKMLMSRGINVYCYLEAKEISGSDLALAVSIYCDNY